MSAFQNKPMPRYTPQNLALALALAIQKNLPEEIERVKARDVLLFGKKAFKTDVSHMLPAALAARVA